MRSSPFRIFVLVVAILCGVARPARADDDEHGVAQGEANANASRPATDSASAAPRSDKVVLGKSEFSAYTDSDHVTVFSPSIAASIESPTTGWAANGSYLVDVVSAASVDIVSTASNHWTETRHAAALGTSYNPGTLGVSVAGSVSREPDYLSLGGGGGLALQLDDKTVNPTLTYGYSHDTAGRSTTPFSVYHQTLQRHVLSAALELILDPSTVATLSVDGIFEIGDQKKPYRMLPMFAPDVLSRITPGASIDTVNELRLPGRVAENTPLTRNRFAFTGRLAQRLAGSTFTLSERVYVDDWGLKASTTDLRFLVDMSRRVFIWTHLRAHVQSGVSFWRLAYTGSFASGVPMSVPALRTGDRELGPLAGGTFGLGLRWNVGGIRPETWSIVTQADVLLTRFNDTLFIVNREGIVGTAAVEAEF